MFFLRRCLSFSEGTAWACLFMSARFCVCAKEGIREGEKTTIYICIFMYVCVI